MYKKNCEYCNELFETNQNNSKYCKKHITKNMVLRVHPNTPTKHIGSSSELAVCIDLLDKGYEVFRNVSSHGHPDIMAHNNKQKILKIEVTTGYINKLTNQRGYSMTDKKPEHCNVIAVCYIDTITYYKYSNGKEINIEITPTNTDASTEYSNKTPRANE